MRYLFLAIFLFLTVSLSAQQQKREVDLRAELMMPIKKGDSTIIRLLNSVVFHNEGAVILCDSAYRYNDKYIEFFSNVIINKDSVYVYGDRVVFDGLTNIAQVYSPIIKLGDRENKAVLYTRGLDFHVKTNIGRYFDGGTITQEDNLIESMRGRYEANTKDIYLSSYVAIKNPDYLMYSDSVKYNMDSQISNFYRRSYIWNDKGETLTAKAGMYDRNNDRYEFTEDSYVLRPEQEIWADTMEYDAKDKNMYLRSNIQVNDSVQQAMAFGDWARYIGSQEYLTLSKKPSVLSYKDGDSTYMRADSMLMITPSLVPQPVKIDSAKKTIDSLPQIIQPDSVLTGFGGAPDLIADSLQYAAFMDSFKINQPTDSILLEQNNIIADTIVHVDVPKEKTKRELKEERKALEQAEKERKRIEKQEQKRLKELERRKKKEVTVDTLLTSNITIDSLAIETMAVADVDNPSEIPVDSLSVAKNDTMTTQKPQVERIFRGYKNVKLFKSDLQAVCDSIVGFSKDSTMHMYKDPVLWNDQNQITSDVVDIFIKNQTINKAEFIGNAISAEQLADSVGYNQLGGRKMEAFFDSTGNISSILITGNAETIFYNFENVKEDSTTNKRSETLLAKDSITTNNDTLPLALSDSTMALSDTLAVANDSIAEPTKSEVTSMLYATSSSVRIRFDSLKQAEFFIWIDNVDMKNYPIPLIPADQILILKNFKWKGELRPSKEDVFDRKIKASFRKAINGVPKPKFQITSSIDADKEKFSKSGSWIDRDDKVYIDISEFQNYDSF